MDKNKNASTAAATVNPNDASARGLYAPVVAKEGTVDGKPARVALYGTRYAACEVESGGEWTVYQDVGFGGIRGIGQLKQYLDDVAVEPAPVVAVVAEVVAPAVEVVPAAVEPEPVVETAPAVVEPVLNTLDEVRAAFDAETRGACRASVLRALRVRAGEIALGLPAGGKIEKAASTPKPSSKWSVWATEQSANLDDMDEIIVPFADIVAAGFGESVTKYAACWSPESSTAGRALASVGLRGKLTKDGIKITKL